MTDTRLGYTIVEALVDIRPFVRVGYTTVEVLWSTEDLGAVLPLQVNLADATPAFEATLSFSAYTGTLTRNLANGRHRRGGFIDESPDPVAVLPANLARRVDKAIAYPTPTLVDGRPT